MWWPFRREKRESSFTDELVTAILARSTGASLALPTATAALETASGIIARAFASAEVNGPSWAVRALSPACLALIGRALIRQGEFLAAIDVDGGELRLWPAADHDVTGGYDPAEWRYRLNLAGPSYLATRTTGAEGVVHVMYSADPARPWHGIGPIDSAIQAGRLSAETAKTLADEASGPRGHLLPIPVDGTDPTVEKLKIDIRNLRGNMALVESQSAGWDGGDRATSPRGDWDPKRLGANPPAALVELHSMATKEILSTCGISAALFDPRAAAAAREAYRQLLHGVVAPLGRILASELSAKLEASVSFDWQELRAGDIAGRARAFQSMVGAGMDVAKAAALAGLMAPEEA